MTNAERQKRHREKLKELRESNAVTKKGGSVTEGVTDVIQIVTPVTVEWDREKYPERRAWEIAVARVERARKYAEMFPNMVHQSDLKFQEIGWQYENEGLPALKNLGQP